MEKRHFNTSYYETIFREREIRYKKKIEEQDKLNVLTVIMSLVIILSLFFYSMSLKRQLFKAEIQLRQYQIHYEDTVNSKEMKAVNKCKNEDYWKAECIAYELNERRK